MNPAVSPTTIDTLPRFPRQVLNSIIIHVRGEEFIQKGNPEGKKKIRPPPDNPPLHPPRHLLPVYHLVYTLGTTLEHWFLNLVDREGV